MVDLPSLKPPVFSVKIVEMAVRSFPKLSMLILKKGKFT
jgi:hypothetical protein